MNNIKARVRRFMDSHFHPPLPAQTRDKIAAILEKGLPEEEMLQALVDAELFHTVETARHYLKDA